MTQTCRNCHREHNRPISFLFRPRTSLRCSPGGHPRNPARDVRAISLVLCAKRALQRRLFIGNDEQVEGQPEQCAEQNEARIAEQHSLTKNDCDDGDVDRIAYIPVETCDHQVLGWRNGCRCAESLKRKSRKGVHESGQTDQDEEDADCPRDLKTQKCRPKRQPFIDHGISPASTHGATTKKSAEPKTALTFCMVTP